MDVHNSADQFAVLWMSALLCSLPEDLKPLPEHVDLCVDLSVDLRD